MPGRLPKGSLSASRDLRFHQVSEQRAPCTLTPGEQAAVWQGCECQDGQREGPPQVPAVLARGRGAQRLHGAEGRKEGPGRCTPGGKS